MPSLIDLMLEGRKIRQHSPWPRVVVDASVWTFAASELAQGRWSLLGLWGEPATVHMAIMDGQTAEIAVVSLDCPDRTFPSVGRHHPPAFGWNAPSTICSDCRAEGSARCPPLARSQPLGRALSAWEIASTPCRRRRPIASCRSKATACTRSRSARCMRVSSSPDISALPPAARPWSGSNSGLDTSTRASRG